MKPFVHDITGIDPLAAFAAIKHMPYSLLLDSADRAHPASRYSFVMGQPIETIEAKGHKISITNWEQRLSFTGNPFAILEERLNVWVPQTTRIPNMPPFQGGAAGLFGYDLGRILEKIPATAKDEKNVPDMAIGIYDQVLAHDHLLKKSWIFTHARNAQEATRKRDHFISLLTREVEPPSYEPVELDWYANFNRKTYSAAVQKVIDYIHAGDIFQANIAQRFDAQLPDEFDPFIHYVHLRKVNPAPFAAYMNLGKVKLSSSSPERFLTLKDNKVETCPIKGTRPRLSNFTKDRANQKDLLSSEKDRAENTMIVDLLRNDLSKVCEPHSIEVPALCKLESFASVHHLVSTITARLKGECGPIDLLRACFPGGSITGAPKIRAMEIIEEIEPTRRAAYCGSIGYIGFDGSMDTNILIRTLSFHNNKVSLQTGGGIVAESDPESEYQETLDKAHKILDSFGEQDPNLKIAV